MKVIEGEDGQVGLILSREELAHIMGPIWMTSQETYEVWMQKRMKVKFTFDVHNEVVKKLTSFADFTS